MSDSTLRDFLRDREKLDETVLGYADSTVKRFYSLDAVAYKDGSLSSRSKELLGLVASLVLRCDDCITWHLSRCFEEGVSTEELVETLGIGMLVGGSVTIPHVRKLLDHWSRLLEGK